MKDKITVSSILGKGALCRSGLCVDCVSPVDSAGGLEPEQVPKAPGALAYQAGAALKGRPGVCSN